MPMQQRLRSGTACDLTVDLALKVFVWLALQVNPTVIATPTWAFSRRTTSAPCPRTDLPHPATQRMTGRRIDTSTSDIRNNRRQAVHPGPAVAQPTLEAASTAAAVREQRTSSAGYCSSSQHQKLFPGVYDFVTVATFPDNVIGLGDDDRLRSRVTGVRRPRIRHSCGRLPANGRRTPPPGSQQRDHLAGPR